MHDTNRTSGQGLDRENLEKTQKDLILGIAGVDSTDDKSVTSVRTKITDGQELLKLYTEFERLFSGRREEALKTGFVGSNLTALPIAPLSAKSFWVSIYLKLKSISNLSSK